MWSPTVNILGVTLAAAFGIFLILIWSQEALQVRFPAPQAPPQTESTPIAASTDPFCKFIYYIPNWEGQDIPVCDASICKGRDKLKLLPPPAAGFQQSRWSAFDEATYLKMFEDNTIAGWLRVRLQEQHGISCYVHI
jgi:predicted outer membrane lipoprotein